MTALTTPQQIGRFRLATILSGVKLEAKGLKLSRGQSCTAIAKQMLGLPRNTKREVIIALFTEYMQTAE
jgi:hypothetical protein